MLAVQRRLIGLIGLMGLMGLTMGFGVQIGP